MCFLFILTYKHVYIIPRYSTIRSPNIKGLGKENLSCDANMGGGYIIVSF